jgi:uncharacterized protein
MQATLWIEAGDTDDFDLFIGVEKWAGGRYVPFEGSYGFGRDRITTGWQRMSLRSIDETPPTFDQPRPLQPGKCVPVNSGRPPRKCAGGTICGWYLRAVGCGHETR